MNPDHLLALQFGLLALLTLALLIFWGDIPFSPVRALPRAVQRLGGFLVLALMVGVLFAPKFVPELAGPNVKGKAIELDWPLVYVSDGKRVSLKDFQGKVLFVNLWATWCGPCVAEMPSIERLYQKFEGRNDVAFLLISQDQAPELPRQFVVQRKLKTPVYFSAGPHPKDFKTSGIPATFIIRKDGSLEHLGMGSQDWSRDVWVNLLNSLAKQ
jgi:thiol-disulfide isomerase/thioredoxin